MSEKSALYRVELVTGETALMSFSEGVDELEEHLDEAETILACPDCGDLVPVTGGVPQKMPRCPFCGDPLQGVDEVHRIDWVERARELHEEGGVPERRAEVVALIEAGCSHTQAAEILGLNNRSNVASHLRDYREEDLPQAKWLAENGPEV